MSVVILPKGSYIFHGTCEKLSGNLRPGIDRLVWFADNPAISHLYICQSGILSYFRSQDLINNPGDYASQVNKYLGIKPTRDGWLIPDPKNWKPSREVLEARNLLDSSRSELESALARLPLLESKVSQAQSAIKALEYNEKKTEDLEVLLGELDPDSDEYERVESEQDALFDAWAELNDAVNNNPHILALKTLKREISSLREKVESADISLRYLSGKDEKRKVESLVREAGFKDPRGDGNFEFLMSRGEMLPPGEYVKGTLVVGKTTKDMVLWDKATKGMNSLLDPQYNDFQGFRDAEQRGLDGVFIKDYAQSAARGNFGHLSVGIFSHALKNIRYKYLEASYHEWDGRSPVWSGPVSDFSTLKPPRK